MATPFTKDLARELTIPGHGTVVVTISEHGIKFRRKGRRQPETMLPYLRAIARADLLDAGLLPPDTPRGKKTHVVRRGMHFE